MGMKTPWHLVCKRAPAIFPPEYLLRRRWRKSTFSEFAMHLRRVCIGEFRCHTGEYPRQLAPRFRWKRLAMARKFVAAGGEVRPLIHVHSIPRQSRWTAALGGASGVPMRQRWPGAAHLVPFHQRFIGSPGT